MIKKRRKPHPVRTRKPRKLDELSTRDTALMAHAMGLLRDAVEWTEARARALRALMAAVEAVATSSFGRKELEALTKRLAEAEAFCAPRRKP